MVVKGLRSRRELHLRREAKEVQEIHQRWAIFSCNSREEKQRNDQGRQADRTTDREKGGGWGKRELGAGDVPSRRISPCTLLSYERSFPSRWPQRLEEEEEGGGEDIKVRFFFFFPPTVVAGCASDGPTWTVSPHSERGKG